MKGMQEFLLIFGLLSMQVKFSLAKYAADCTAADNKVGKCMPLKSCRQLYGKLLDIRTYAANDSNVLLLRQSQCDYKNNMPFVCCPVAEIQVNPAVYAELENLSCGVNKVIKIANGDVANIFDYRWMALLKFSTGLEFRCGASLISDRYVLTAAHCVWDELPTAVRLGEYNLSTEIDCIHTRRSRHCLPPHEDIDIEKIFKHEDYTFRGIHHDIALIRLVRLVVFKENIRPICLPITKDLQTIPVTDYLVAGWGRTEASRSSDVLLYTIIPWQSREICTRELRLSGAYQLTEGHICAGGEERKDSCKGDSGSPLFSVQIYTDNIARAIQYGIVSVGVNSCGLLSKPAIYTNVSHYMQWITDHMSFN